MNHTWKRMRECRIRLSALALASLVLVAGPLSPAVAMHPKICVKNSSLAADGSLLLINGSQCASYGMVTTRQTASLQSVTLPYMVNEPQGTPEALVVLLAGAQGAAGITPAPAGTSANFLVRSAELFAAKGLLAVTVDVPSDHPADSYAAYGNYRISQAHAVDIASVIAAVNTSHLPTFLVGTSAGALSAVAQNKLVGGSMLSSPVTSSSSGYFVGDASPHAELQTSFVEVPVQVLEHVHDGCSNSAPSSASALWTELGQHVQATYRTVTGGFEVDSDPCEAKTYHGYLGIERKAVDAIADRISAILSNRASTAPGNHQPIAGFGTLRVNADGFATIDLAALASDLDGQPLSFSLPHPRSTFDASLGLQGTMVTYTGPGSFVPDSFVYTVRDGQGGRAAGVLTRAP